MVIAVQLIREILVGPLFYIFGGCIQFRSPWIKVDWNFPCYFSQVELNSSLDKTILQALI